MALMTSVRRALPALAMKLSRADLALAMSLVGLDVIARLAPHAPNFTPVAASALFAGAVLRSRSLAVAVPLAAMARLQPFMPGTYPMLVWGGLRGGISIALALTLPAGDLQALLLTTTYVVVVFSVAIQGTTVGLTARRLLRPEQTASS